MRDGKSVGEFQILEVLYVTNPSSTKCTNKSFSDRYTGYLFYVTHTTIHFDFELDLKEKNYLIQSWFY